MPCDPSKGDCYNSCPLDSDSLIVLSVLVPTGVILSILIPLGIKCCVSRIQQKRYRKIIKEKHEELKKSLSGYIVGKDRRPYLPPYSTREGYPYPIPYEPLNSKSAPPQPPSSKSSKTVPPPKGWKTASPPNIGAMTNKNNVDEDAAKRGNQRACFHECEKCKRETYAKMSEWIKVEDEEENSNLK